MDKKKCGAKSRHGMAIRVNGRLPKVYSIWVGMKNRCCNPKNANYPNYGGRGITLCERWLEFENFHADMGDPPSPDHTLDRIRNEAGYEPRNCRWATRKEQANNRRSTNLLTFRGKTQSVAAWAEELGFSRVTLSIRLNVYKWPVEKTLTTPVADGGPHTKLVTLEGRTQSIRAWCKEKGLNKSTVTQRISLMGWSAEKALTTPPALRGPGAKEKKAKLTGASPPGPSE